MFKLWHGSRRRTKLLASFAVLAAAASIAGLGTFATFSSSTSADQSVSTGLVTLDFGTLNRLTVGASGLAAGDTVQRAFDLRNSGTVDFNATPTLTTTETPTNALTDGTANGLTMKIEKCSAAWSESGPPYTYTCGGTKTTVLATQAVIGSGLSLSNLSDLISAPATDHLMLTLTLPQAATQAVFGGLSSTLTYTFNATQRNATDK